MKAGHGIELTNNTGRNRNGDRSFNIVFKLILKKINAIRHVDRTVTQLVLNTVKDERRIFP